MQNPLFFKAVRLGLIASFPFFTSSANGVDLAECDWLQPLTLADSKNATMEFRSEFNSTGNGAAELLVSADAVYSVRLNGRDVVASARLPDVEPHRFYDVWKVDGIRSGNNVLEFSVYSPGIDTSHFRKGPAGLRFALSGDGCAVTSSDPILWRRSVRDIAEGVPLLTVQLGFSFEYDANLPEAQWKPVGAGDRKRFAKGEELEKRPFDPPSVLPFVAAKLVAEGSLEDAAVPKFPAAGIDNAKRSPKKSEGNNRWLLLDLGREDAGLFEMEIETDAGAVIDIGHAEHSEDNRIVTNMGGRNFAGRYRAREGRQRFLRWQYRMAGRFIMLDVRNVKSRFVLHRAGIRPVIRTDLDLAPMPNGMSERQKAIWRTSVRTLMLCMHEHYEDCPWREQCLYANDGRNQMLAGRFAFVNDAAFAAHSLDLLARGLDAGDCWLELCMPGRIEITIPSFTLSWLLAVADFQRLYGVRRDDFEAVAMQIVERRISEMREGLLPRPEGKRYWQFYDWAPGLDGAVGNGSGVRFDAPLNLLFLQALESLELKSQPGRWRDVASALRKAIVAKFWDKERQCLFTHAVPAESSASVSPNYHELTQALALLNGCVPEESRLAVAEKLSRKNDWVETTLSQTLQKYEALLKTSPAFKPVVLQHVDSQWGRMLDAGATSFWEVREGWRAFNDAGSLCHGWSAIPIYVYSKILSN